MNLRQRVNKAELLLDQAKAQGRTGVVFRDELPLPPTKADPYYGVLLVPRPMTDHDRWQEAAQRQQRLLEQAAREDTPESWQRYFDWLAQSPQESISLTSMAID